LPDRHVTTQLALAGQASGLIGVAERGEQQAFVVIGA
jgi:hypothetical protein